MRRYLPHIPLPLQPCIDDWHFRESEERYYKNPPNPPITRKEIMEKANKAELLRMKQDAENRGAGITRSPKLPTYTPSTPYTAPKQTGALTPRQDNNMECYNYHRTGHLSRDCLAPRKQNNFQSSSYQSDKTSNTADAFCEFCKGKHHTRDQCQKLAKAHNLLTHSTPPSGDTQPKKSGGRLLRRRQFTWLCK